MTTTKTITLYTAQELKDLDYRAYERALSEFQESESSDIPWVDETIDSLKEIIKQSGLTLSDWNLSTEAYRSYIKVTGFDTFYYDFGDLTGQRALAWIENNLLHKLRQPYKPMIARRAHYSTPPGHIDPYSLTGYCADYDFVRALINNVKWGCTLKNAYERLADTCAHLLEKELEYATSEENFLETSDANDWKFTDAGELTYV